MRPEEYERMLKNATASVRAINPPTIEPAARVNEIIDTAQLAEIRRLATLGMHPTTDEASLNKTEIRYLHWLKCTQPLWFGVQCITFKMGHDLRYTPDFLALDSDGLRAIDTKATRKDTGKALVEEDSMIKARICARMFPFIRFVIAHEVGLIWNHVEIKP